MELRYMGFQQKQNRRLYRFDRNDAGNKSSIPHVVSVDMELFLKHHVGIQEGPALCAQKITADLEADHQGDHELTNEDLLASRPIAQWPQSAKRRHAAAVRRAANRSPASPSAPGGAEKEPAAETAGVTALCFFAAPAVSAAGSLRKDNRARPPVAFLPHHSWLITIFPKCPAPFK